MASLKAISGFEALTPSISLHRPQTSDQASSTHPDLIVICSWMAATRKHIAKYTDQYLSLFPDSTILLIQSSMTDMRASDEKMVLRLKAAVEIVNSFSDREHRARIVFHAFSNGGGTIATHLALALRAPGLWDRIIFECLPGRPRVEQGVNAIAYSLPKNTLAQFFGRWLIRIWSWVGLFSVSE